MLETYNICTSAVVTTVHYSITYHFPFPWFGLFHNESNFLLRWAWVDTGSCAIGHHVSPSRVRPERACSSLIHQCSVWAKFKAKQESAQICFLFFIGGCAIVFPQHAQSMSSWACSGQSVAHQSVTISGKLLFALVHVCITIHTCYYTATRTPPGLLPTWLWND